MSLTYLKEAETAYSDRLVTAHCSSVPLMPQRKFNVRANFTPGSNSASSLPANTVTPPHQVPNGKAAFTPAFEHTRHVAAPFYGAPPSAASTRPSLYSSADAGTMMHRAAEPPSNCGCPSRRINVLNLPPSQLNLFLDVLARVGDIEQKPEFEGDNQLALQFYDLRAAQKLAGVLPSIAPLAGATLRHVPLESDVCVLIDIPWGHSVTYSALLAPLKQYGSVATLTFGKTLIGGPQQAVCVYHDVRDATKVLNRVISVNGVQLPVRLLSLPHSHTCQSANAQSRQQAQTSFGIGLGSLESPPVPTAFASPSTTASMSPLASPYSTARSDLSSSYFSSAESSWIASTKAATATELGHSDRSRNRLSPQLVGVGTTRQNAAAPTGSGDHDAAAGRTGRSILESASSELFSNGAYGPIGSTTATGSACATSSGNVFDSILSKGPFGNLPAAHDSMCPGRLPLHQPQASGAREVVSLPENMNALKLSDGPLSRHSNAQAADKHPSSIKRRASTDADMKAEHKEARPAERERGNDIDLEAIASGAETRTTVMLRNIPNKLDFKDLKRFLDATNRCTYDFLYLRFDFMNRCNVGYAFISFTKPKHVATFVKARAGMKWSQYNYNSEKVIEIKFARIQGRDSLIQKFRNSPVMSQDPAFKPRLYYTSGKLSGKEEPFPDPTGSNKAATS